VIQGLPIDPCTVHGQCWTVLLNKPLGQGSDGAIRGHKFAHILPHPAVSLDIAQTGSQMCLMDVNPATHRRHNWHGLSPNFPKATMVWDDGAPAVGT
jgi:hypothetical protein